MSELVMTEVVSTEPEQNTHMSRGKLTLRRFLRNKSAIVGAVCILLLVSFAVFGQFISYWGYLDIDNKAFLKPPSSSHPLGTTQSGRDVMALLIHGLGRSLIIGFFVAIIATSIAALVGTTAAYFSGWTERIEMWIVDLLLIVPYLLIVATATKGLFKDKDSSWVVLAVILALFSWMTTSRVVRSLTISLKHREFIQAAEFMGLSKFRIIVRHLIPNVSSLLIIDATLGVGGAILGETGLSFLGFGIKSPDSSLGTLIAEGAPLATSHTWIFAAPAITLVFLVFCVYLVGDGLRDALDPTSNSGGQA